MRSQDGGQEQEPERARLDKMVTYVSRIARIQVELEAEVGSQPKRLNGASNHNVDDSDSSHRPFPLVSVLRLPPRLLHPILNPLITLTAPGEGYGLQLIASTLAVACNDLIDAPPVQAKCKPHLMSMGSCLSVRHTDEPQAWSWRLTLFGWPPSGRLAVPPFGTRSRSRHPTTQSPTRIHDVHNEAPAPSYGDYAWRCASSVGSAAVSRWYPPLQNREPSRSKRNSDSLVEESSLPRRSIGAPTTQGAYTCFPPISGFSGCNNGEVAPIVLAFKPGQLGGDVDNCALAWGLRNGDVAIPMVFDSRGDGRGVWVPLRLYMFAEYHEQLL
ncbi:hypothetical protein FA13DRAFT_1844527 [Coprinellus micaceus]|uniref:Uncharacterized protein n=1 Tax=Coprinellus micaceus TaxID=71717 RepID=A0A4Y7TC16_COPMI|nr:hypothetical protein FA13DRAFT_1844527 [Coprinellus micaceus]